MKKNGLDRRILHKPPPYTVKAAAKYLSVSTDTIHAWIKAGVLRASTLCPRKFLIPAADVENLVESTCDSLGVPVSEAMIDNRIASARMRIPGA